MALHARRRIDPAVDPVLVEVISAVRQGPLNGILVFIARLQFIPVRMAVRAEGLLVANSAGLGLLLREEAVPLHIITGMVHRRPPVLVAIAAQGGRRYLNGVLHCPAGRMGTGIDAEEHHEH